MKITNIFSVSAVKAFVLAMLVASVTACVTNSTRETETEAEPLSVAQELLDRGQALSKQGKTQEAIAVLSDLDQRFRLDKRRAVQSLVAEGLILRTQISPTDTLTIPVSPDSTLPKGLVESLFEKAAALTKGGNLMGAIPIYGEIERLCANDKPFAVWAAFYQGDLQRQLRRNKTALDTFERLDQNFGQERDPAVQSVVADALLKKSEIQTGLNDIKGALATYGEIDKRYAEKRDPNLRRRAVQALFAKGALLAKQGAGEETESEVPLRSAGDAVAAVAVYDDMIQRFGRDKDPTIRNMIGATLLKKSETLRLTGDTEGMLATYDDIVERFGRDDSQIARVLVATALFRKGQALGRQEGNTPVAINVFDDLIRRFATDNSPNVRKIVGQAVTARQKLMTETEPIKPAAAKGDVGARIPMHDPMHDN